MKLEQEYAPVVSQSHTSAVHTSCGQLPGGCGFLEGTSGCSVSDRLGRETGGREGGRAVEKAAVRVSSWGLTRSSLCQEEGTAWKLQEDGVAL